MSGDLASVTNEGHVNDLFDLRVRLLLGLRSMALPERISVAYEPGKQQRDTSMPVTELKQNDKKKIK